MENKIETIEIGKSTIEFSGLALEAIAHETQYAVHITFRGSDGKPLEKDAFITMKISDAEETLYQENKEIKKSDFKNEKVILLLPYEKVKKSLYDNGNLSVTAQIDARAFEKTIDIPVKSYTEAEKKQIEEEQFINNSIALNNKISYVGFDFFVQKGGIIVIHDPYPEKFIRFDVELKNQKSSPTYLVRDDFYLKDSKKTFYPVFATKSTAFGPLLKPFEQFNASFYFKVFNKNDTYSFYYGDKKLGEVTQHDTWVDR